MNCSFDRMAELQIPSSSSREKHFSDLFSSCLLIHCNLFCEDAGVLPVLALHSLYSQNVQISVVFERRCVFNTV